MTRKFLNDLGLDKDLIDKIMSEHGNTVELVKEKVKDEAEKLSEKLNIQIENLTKQCEKLQSDLDNAPKPDPDGVDWRGEHEKIKGEYEDFKKTVETEAVERKTGEALRKRLLSDNLNPKYADIVVEKTLKSAKLDKNGEVDDYEMLVKPHKDAFPEWFAIEDKKGFTPANPPINQSVSDPFLQGFDEK